MTITLRIRLVHRETSPNSTDFRLGSYVGNLQRSRSPLELQPAGLKLLVLRAVDCIVLLQFALTQTRFYLFDLRAGDTSLRDFGLCNLL